METNLLTLGMFQNEVQPCSDVGRGQRRVRLHRRGEHPPGVYAFPVLFQNVQKRWGRLTVRMEDKDDIRALAQVSAVDACTQFTEYQTDGCKSSYWYGVAAFRSFQQAYYSLTEGTNRADNYTFCNEVYGYLVLNPENSQSYISESIETMSILSSDVEDENGYIRMSELRNSLIH